MRSCREANAGGTLNATQVTSYCECAYEGLREHFADDFDGFKDAEKRLRNDPEDIDPKVFQLLERCVTHMTATAPAVSEPATTTPSVPSTTTLSISKIACDRTLSTLQETAQTMEDLFDQFVAAGGSGDLDRIQALYTEIDRYVAVVPWSTNVFLEECGSHYATGDVSTLRSRMAEVLTTWDEVQRECRIGLADFGFEC